MKCWFAVTLAVVALGSSPAAWAQGNYDAQWIWLDVGDPARQAPESTVWFRREVRAAEPSTGSIRIVCDDRFVFWVNGERIGEGGGEKLFRFSLNNVVGRGLNVIAVEGTNAGGKAGLFIDGEIRGQSGRKTTFDTGAEWKVTTARPKGDAWRQRRFDDARWSPARVIGPHSSSPWKSIVLRETYLDRYTLAPGFEIERIAEPELVGTLISMTGGNRGRLIVAVEKGPILSVIDEDRDGVYDKAIKYSTDVQNCQGMCMVFDELYAVGKGPQGVGIYRLPDRDHDDVADGVEHVARVKGSMVDHGPHAVVFGPDGWMYHNMGNHARITSEPEPTTLVRGSYEGNLLRPRFEDGRGHAAGIKVPAGTIWRFTPDGSRWWCETAGFRNEYDFAFHPAGEMFSFDSDMEWDVGLPWYRPVRVNHCIPGAEFGWRSGAAKWPEYYFDSLPGTADAGRGSPTGVIFYDHRQFPEKYRGAFLICDWSVGRILAVHLEPNGASYTGTLESLVAGNPLNVSDIEIDRDGSMIFCTGGRGTEGGIYRVSYRRGDRAPATAETVEEALELPQPQSTWAREILAAVKQSAGDDWESKLVKAARNGSSSEQLRALTLLCQLGPKPGVPLLIELLNDDDAQVRAFATHLLGDHKGEDVARALARMLVDPAPFVRRRACEAHVRSGTEPPVGPLLNLLGGNDRWLRFSARLALERVPSEKWRDQVFASQNPYVVTNGLLALRRVESDVPSSDEALALEYEFLKGARGRLSDEQKVDVLRSIELSLLAGGKGTSAERIGEMLLDAFPTGDASHDAESARILAVLQVPGAAEKLVKEMETADTRTQQMHYALCLRYLNAGWSFDLKRRLLVWYDGTRDWEGGRSFVPYLANIVGASLERYDADERSRLLRTWSDHPFAASLLLRKSQPEQIDGFDDIVREILAEPEHGQDPRRDELVALAIEALGRSHTPAARTMLYGLYERYPDLRESLARAMASNPVKDDWPPLIRTLQFAESTTLQLCLDGLRKLDRQPEKADEFRFVILAGLKLRDRGGRVAVRLLSRWTDRPSGDNQSVADRLAEFQQWYAERFPDAPPAELPMQDLKTAKYAFDELYNFLEKDPKGDAGDAARGRKIFASAKCLKCHRFRDEGETVGPDLTSLRRRFQRKEIIESLVFPSQVISDQYRMVQVATESGQIHVGMPLPNATNAEKLVILLPDATQLAISKDEIAEQARSKISVMPDGLLKDLSLDDIADLFAFLETSKFNPVTPSSASANASAKGE